MEVFAQNINITRGNARIFAALAYSGSPNSSLVPVTGISKLLAVPIGQGFRIVLSRYEKQLQALSGNRETRNIRATRSAFLKIIETGIQSGFKLVDITLSRGNSEVVSVRNDSLIADEMYRKFSNDVQIIPNYVGFTSGTSSVTFDIDMHISCSDYNQECGLLIFDAVSRIVEEENLYRSLDEAFIPKRDESWAAAVNPVHVDCSFGSLDGLAYYISSFFPGTLDLIPTGKDRLYFSSENGVWGEMILRQGGVDVYFKSSADLSTGVRLIDTLNMGGTP